MLETGVLVLLLHWSIWLILTYFFNSSTSGAETSHTSRAPKFSPVVLCGSCFSIVIALAVWCFIYHCLSFCPFSFGHHIVCPSIYSFWLPLWYLQTVLTDSPLAHIYVIFLILQIENCKSWLRHLQKWIMGPNELIKLYKIKAWEIWWVSH